LVCVHAAWRVGTARHVYLLQTAAVGGYALLRVSVARGLPPQLDAVAALILGFVLVGVTVQARRAGIPPVADATRRFAALLPVVIALVLPHRADLGAALLSAGAGALYTTLAYVERSRWFGSLGAAAGNLALLIIAIAGGLDGPEVYLAPMGLLILIVGQIFRDGLGPSSRLGVRIVGGLVLYLPAAIQLTLEVGNGASGLYALAFGVVCLAGVAVGMLLHIRAFLALGTGFLVLDIASHLIRAGVRDHRVGFLLLSATGLSILGVMMWITLRREQALRILGAFQTRLAGWE
jgi:hypothetical protein